MTQETAKTRFRPPPPEARNRNRRTGFTLIELAVALTIILLIVTMVVPTMMKMLSSRASMEAFNLVAAQLSAARAEAVTGNTYAGVHVQLNDETEMADKTAYSMIIYLPQSEVTKEKPVFTRHPVFLPQELPGRTAMGKLTKDFVTDGNPGKYTSLDVPPFDSDDPSAREQAIAKANAQLQVFCAFSVIFSPEGSVVTQRVKKGGVRFDKNDLIFAEGDRKLWNFDLTDADNNPTKDDDDCYDDLDDHYTGSPGVSAFTMFNYLELLKLDSSTGRTDYLNKNGQFLHVNMHTGQLFDRQ